jgi:hypothetical protein
LGNDRPYWKDDDHPGHHVEHVTKSLKYPPRDPFLSTWSDNDIRKELAGNGYVYTLDSTKITEMIWDVQAEYDRINKKNPYEREKQFAVELMIPWAAVTKIQHKNKGGEWKDIRMPEQGPSRALNILASYVPGAPTLTWLLLDTNYGSGVGCRTDYLTEPRVDPWVTAAL